MNKFFSCMHYYFYNEITRNKNKTEMHNRRQLAIQQLPLPQDSIYIIKSFCFISVKTKTAQNKKKHFQMVVRIINNPCDPYGCEEVPTSPPSHVTWFQYGHALFKPEYIDTQFQIKICDACSNFITPNPTILCSSGFYFTKASIEAPYSSKSYKRIFCNCVRRVASPTYVIDGGNGRPEWWHRDIHPEDYYSPETTLSEILEKRVLPVNCLRKTNYIFQRYNPSPPTTLKRSRSGRLLYKM